MFSLICAWINAWVNNREAGDLRRHRSHYGVMVMPQDRHPMDCSWERSVSCLLCVQFLLCWTFFLGNSVLYTISRYMKPCCRGTWLPLTSTWTLPRPKRPFRLSPSFVQDQIFVDAQIWPTIPHILFALQTSLTLDWSAATGIIAHAHQNGNWPSIFQHWVALPIDNGARWWANLKQSRIVCT